MKLMIFLSAVGFCLSCQAQSQGYNKAYALNIIELTRDELPLHIALDVAQDHQRVGIILITNLELIWMLSSELESDDAIFSELEEILLNGYIEYSANMWDDFYIGDSYTHYLTIFTVDQIIATFFNDNGSLKEGLDEALKKEIIAHLIRNGVLVHQGAYFNYNVFVVPE